MYDACRYSTVHENCSGSCRQLHSAQKPDRNDSDQQATQALSTELAADSLTSLLKQSRVKQKRIEALEQAARAAQAQHKTDLAEHQQQLWQLQQKLLAQERQSSHAQACSSTTDMSPLHPRHQMQSQLQRDTDTSELSVSALQELVYEGQCQVADQAEQIAQLQKEAHAADTQLEKLSNLLQAQEAHTQRLEIQLDSTGDAAKPRIAKVTVQHPASVLLMLQSVYPVLDEARPCMQTLLLTKLAVETALLC